MTTEQENKVPNTKVSTSMPLSKKISIAAGLIYLLTFVLIWFPRWYMRRKREKPKE